MPATTPPNSRSRVVQSGQIDSVFTHSTRLEPTTPERNRDATPPGATSTPLSVGTAIIQKLQPDEDQPRKYDSAKYEQYIVQDFERHRVFIDIDVFMKQVLHVPEDWKTLWGRTIRRIKRDAAFSIAHWEFTRHCGTQGIQEKMLYKPLVDMTNAIVNLSHESPDDSVKPRTRVRYLRNDPRKILCGLMKDLSPDIVAVHDGFIPQLSPEEDSSQRLKTTNLTWAQPLQALEVKPFDCALVDGSYMPRLKVNGRDPQQDHARPHVPSRYPKKEEKPVTTEDPTDEGAASAPELSVSRKRPADGPQESSRNPKSQKLGHKSTPGGSSAQVGPRTGETECQKQVYLQVGRYLLEKFAVPAFRSHATIGLVDRDRIQFYHANRSVILVSSAINFSASDRTGGLDKFIAIVIAFNRLSLRDNGILHNLRDGKLFRDNETLTTLPASSLTRGAVRIQAGNKLEFGGDEKTGPFTLTYGDVISHEPSLTGRSTVVLHAKSPRWKDLDLVVKISWPGSQRVSECEFINKATELAGNAAEHRWALDHLPRVFFAQDVTFASDSTYEKVASLFDEAEFVNGEYKYERRTLRIIIQERLYPLKTLANQRDIAQVLLDVACIHRWLRDHGILHRDLSPNNIMHRILAGKVHGVLTDYDLASWVSPLTPDHTKTSQQRTGTPPFMANGLLDGTDTVHLYRHDVESLFYIMLILATHYEIQAPKEEEGGGMRVREGKLPFQSWFEMSDYNTLGEKKSDFFTKLKFFEVSPSFDGFHGWLRSLRVAFYRGFAAKSEHRLLEDGRVEGPCEEDTRPSFDEETLGGHLTYSALIGPARSFTGKLEGLAIRYDPKTTPRGV